MPMVRRPSCGDVAVAARCHHLQRHRDRVFVVENDRVRGHQLSAGDRDEVFSRPATLLTTSQLVTGLPACRRP